MMKEYQKSDVFVYLTTVVLDERTIFGVCGVNVNLWSVDFVAQQRRFACCFCSFKNVPGL